jgi:hypothetical protein
MLLPVMNTVRAWSRSAQGWRIGAERELAASPHTEL